jgi:hypothetical protein
MRTAPRHEQIKENLVLSGDSTTKNMQMINDRFRTCFLFDLYFCLCLYFFFPRFDEIVEGLHWDMHVSVHP